jgi:hypothetical protein
MIPLHTLYQRATTPGAPFMPPHLGHEWAGTMPEAHP